MFKKFWLKILIKTKNKHKYTKINLLLQFQIKQLLFYIFKTIFNQSKYKYYLFKMAQIPFIKKKEDETFIYFTKYSH